jgi:hypothetical protein
VNFQLVCNVPSQLHNHRQLIILLLKFHCLCIIYKTELQYCILLTIAGEPWNVKTHPDYAPSVQCADDQTSQKSIQNLRRYKMFEMLFIDVTIRNTEDKSWQGCW